MRVCVTDPLSFTSVFTDTVPLTDLAHTPPAYELPAVPPAADPHLMPVLELADALRCLTNPDSPVGRIISAFTVLI